MNKSKLPLPLLLLILSTIGYGFICFLSFYFRTLGNTIESLIAAFIFALIIGGIAFTLLRLKMTHQNFKMCIIWERCLLVLFAIIAALCVIPFSHYFNVSDKKEIIKKDLINNLNKAQGIFEYYENRADDKLNIYNDNLSSAIRNKDNQNEKYINLGFSGKNDSYEKTKMIETLNNSLFPNNYNQKKKYDSLWLINAKNKVENWSPLGVIAVLNTFKSEINSWHAQLNANYTVPIKGVPQSQFVYPPLNNLSNNISKHFTRKSNPGVFAIIIALLLYCLMILSYIITIRSSKNPYTLFKKRNVMWDDSIDIDLNILNS